jgi:glycosyltransferase involved in cell wall biosynthesis
MPAYNAQYFIEKTIQSVQSQSFSGWKLVIVDDCSSDDTVKIVKSIAHEDSRVRLIELKTNFGGPAGPRNVGVASAETDLVAFLDADDIWHPDKIATQLEFFAKHDVDLVCARVLDFYDDGAIQFGEIENSGSENVSYSSERLRNQIPTSSVIVKTSLARKFPFNEAISYRAVEDYDVWLRMLEAGAVCAKVIAPLVMYRKIEGQISGSKWHMLRKVLMVHRNNPNSRFFTPYLYSITHILGAIYSRVIFKRM